MSPIPSIWDDHDYAGIAPAAARHIGCRAAIRLARRYLMQRQSGNDGRTLRVGAGRHDENVAPSPHSTASRISCGGDRGLSVRICWRRMCYRLRNFLVLPTSTHDGRCRDRLGERSAICVDCSRNEWGWRSGHGRLALGSWCLLELQVAVVVTKLGRAVRERLVIAKGVPVVVPNVSSISLLLVVVKRVAIPVADSLCRGRYRNSGSQEY